jgi:hypothetical protein
MATLSTTELITDVIDAFKVRFPLMSAIGTDFSSDEAKLGQTITGRILSLPSVQDYDGTDGYKANSASANSLTTDVSVTLNRHKHVPIKVDFIDQVSTKRDLYAETVGNMAYALGKEAFDYTMGLVTQANFSHEVVGTTANSDYDALALATKVLNKNGASATGRIGIVNSDVFQTLDSDQRIASGDYHGQQKGASAYGVLSNVGGFESIFEYPDLPANSEDLTGFFTDKTGIVMASRIPNDVEALANRIGIPAISKVDVVSDADTGLTMMGITYQDAGTFDVYTTLTWIYGVSAGAQGGTDDSLTDKGGLRLASSAQSSGAFTNAL